MSQLASAVCHLVSPQQFVRAHRFIIPGLNRVCFSCPVHALTRLDNLPHFVGNSNRATVKLQGLISVRHSFLVYICTDPCGALAVE